MNQLKKTPHPIAHTHAYKSPYFLTGFGFGFRVKGLGFLGFGVQGLGFGV